MPRFYFDVWEDETVIPDEEGLELESLDAAQREAAVSAVDIGRSQPPRGKVREITVEVKDENGFVLITATSTNGAPDDPCACVKAAAQFRIAVSMECGSECLGRL